MIIIDYAIPTLLSYTGLSVLTLLVKLIENLLNNDHN